MSSAVIPIVNADVLSPVAIALDISGVFPDTPSRKTAVPFGIVEPVEFLTLLGKLVVSPSGISTLPPANPSWIVPYNDDQFINPSRGPKDVFEFH